MRCGCRSGGITVSLLTLVSLPAARPPSILRLVARTDEESIWLILPVVICLSQRLSHACLSTDFHIVKLRMAH